MLEIIHTVAFILSNITVSSDQTEHPKQNLTIKRFFFIYLFSLKFLQTIPLDFSHFLRTVLLVGCRQPKWWGVQKKYCCDDTGWQVEPDQGTEETSKICDNWCLTVSNFYIVNFQMFKLWNDVAEFYGCIAHNNRFVYFFCGTTTQLRPRLPHCWGS